MVKYLAIQFISAFLSTLFFAIIFKIYRKELFTCGLLGATAWLIFLLVDKISNSLVFASFISALIISIIVGYLSRAKNQPETIYLIPGIITLVPGAGMYQTISALIKNDYKAMIDYGLKTFQVAGVIAIAVIIVAVIAKEE